MILTCPQRLIGDKAYDSDLLDQRLLKVIGFKQLHEIA